MSVQLATEQGWVISHNIFINKTYDSVSNKDLTVGFRLNESLFKIDVPFKKTGVNKKHPNRKRQHNLIDANAGLENVKNVIPHVDASYRLLVRAAHESHLLLADETPSDSNDEALATAERVYTESSRHVVESSNGFNGAEATVRTINDSSYLFPPNCRFYCKDVSDIEATLEAYRYDLVLLDPPWWNKYIRRKKAKRRDHSYKMMYDRDVREIPVERLLAADGLIVVWCTNSPQHLTFLTDELFPKWGVRQIATWYWIKVARNGEPVCPFDEPLKKQPFEQIVFASAAAGKAIPDGKLVMSVPSALHSHKPPLIELLNPFLPSNPKCLEIFARYLLPNWTSYGLEALRLQHMSCYTNSSE